MSVFWSALKRMVNENGTSLASSIAFSFLLSLFPLFVFASSLIAFFGNENLVRDILSQIAVIFPPTISELLTPELNKVLNTKRVELLTIGGFLILFFASTGVQSLRGALNHAYRVEETRSLILLMLISFLFIIQFSIVLVLIGVVVLFVPYFVEYASLIFGGFQNTAAFSQTVSYILAFLIMFCELLLIHAWLPKGKRNLGDIFPGVLISSLLWLGLVYLFAYYVRIAGI